MHPSTILQKALRRLPLTTKQGPHNYYKGNRTGAMGRHTKYGGYVIDFRKVRTYVCPDLSGFNLTPFVTKEIKKTRDTYAHSESKNSLDGKEYLEKWKAEGGNI
ncbi:60S ribosomal protein L27, mitochondrial [Saxophila tyrrhenica]|uniref:60S ribosomal protein L27, mitochondrial n=1 Tax=Saxophila tyrrhenica TaxID=1690608 RepID=A0AAV9PMQ0_9PEZI|nr:60S ribosomal protein L27, mitochondrial [Saxophila tyrrhenica]